MDLLIPLYMVGAGFVLVKLFRSREYKPDVQLMPKNYRGAVGEPTLPFRLQLAALSGAAAENLERHLLGRLVDFDDKAKVEPKKPVAPPSAPPAFRPGEPQSLAEYDGQNHFVPFLRSAIDGMAGAKLSRPQLFLGPPGLGKTLLAKVTAHDIIKTLMRRGVPQPDYILCLASDITERKELDAYIRRANAKLGSILFIDEIHTLATSQFQDKLLLLLDEHRYQFEGDSSPTQLNDFTILAGTTDYGALHPAFRRRFAERQLQPLSEAQIVRVLLGRFDITPDAAALAGSRTHQGGAPWEAIALVTDAQDLARARGTGRIEASDVAEVFRIWNLDLQGLRNNDRAVIKALLGQRKEVRGRTKDDPPTVIYAASEDNVIGMARVDREAYRLDIKPRLMSRGFLLTGSRGQQLTDRAVSLYGHSLGSAFNTETL